MNMSCDEESGNSIPYIDDTNTEDEINRDECHHSLNITEKYCDKNRSIEIKNLSPSDDVMAESRGPVAPLAKIDTCRLSSRRKAEDFPTSRDSVMKLVIRGWNSTISIQGLDNKSLITFKRKGQGGHQQELPVRADKAKARDSFDQSSDRPREKPKKKRWKMLTKSLMAKSVKCDRRGFDERYPKYVLLKNEDEDDRTATNAVRDSYPKMIVLDGEKTAGEPRDRNQRTNAEKPEFKLKRSFKNKTNPMSAKTRETTTGSSSGRAKKSESINSDNTRNDKERTGRRTCLERSRSFLAGRTQTRSKSMDTTRSKEPEIASGKTSQDQALNEIAGVLDETLKMCSDMGETTNGFENVHGGHSGYENYPKFCGLQESNRQGPHLLPHRFCHVSDAACTSCDQIPIYSTRGCSLPACRHVSNQIRDGDQQQNAQSNGQDEEGGPDVDLQNLQFGILSTFFPSSVVLMKTYQNEYADKTNESDNPGTGRQDFSGETESSAAKILEALEGPLPELPHASRSSVRQPNLFRSKSVDLTTSDDIRDLSTVNEFSSSSEETKTKTDDTETTKYLCFHERESADNESLTTTCTVKTDQTSASADKRQEDENEDDKNLSLTRVGHKMYDNLTKLSLKRENEVADATEDDADGRNAGENAAKTSPYNITLESRDNVIKISLPAEKKLNFAILDSDIKIGLDNSTAVEEPNVKIARQTELWHVDGETKGRPKIKLAIADERQVFFSIERNKCRGKCRENPEKLTKEMNVGTDDVDLAGGNFDGTQGTNFKNLSPRKSRLLKNLKEKLDADRTKVTSNSDEMNKKLGNEKLQRSNGFPEVFLVQKIDSGSFAAGRRPEVPPPSTSDVSAPLREYYCEDCLATMRIFEDENPSVKSMVDKFETIIQLKSY